MTGFPVGRTPDSQLIELPRDCRIRGGYLEWTQDQSGVNFQHVYERYMPDTPLALGSANAPLGILSDSLLMEFSELWMSEDDTIADFAGRFGVLYAQSPGKDWSADSVTWSSTDARLGVAKGVGLEVERDPERVAYIGETYIDNVGDVVPVCWRREPLAVWRNASAVVDLLWRLAILLKRAANGRSQPIDAIGAARFWLPDGGEEWAAWIKSAPMRIVAHMQWSDASHLRFKHPNTLEEQRAVLKEFLEWISRIASVRLGIQTGDHARPRIVAKSPWDVTGESSPDVTMWGFGPYHVFSAVVVQLLAEVTTGTGEMCPNCPRIWIRTGREKSCPFCRAEAIRATKRSNWNQHKEVRNATRRTADATSSA